jgi:putative ABC transport system substrate-binding protein
MRRREFIAAIGCVAAAWPLLARAQLRSKLPTIGVIGAGTPQGWSQWIAAFSQRLRELGWIEGRTIAIEYRWAEGSGEREAEIAAEFVRLKVDVMLTVGGAAAKQATSDIPIVFAISSDPLGTGVVASLARPGGNITGFSIQATDLAGKRLELLREAMPGVQQLAIMADFRLQASVLELDGFRAAAEALGLKVTKSELVKPPISNRLSKRSRVAFRRCMSLPTRLQTPTVFASTTSRLARDFRPCLAFGNISKAGA